MTLREFLRQLPHHKPWMITISVISMAVVFSACGFGSVLLLRDEGQTDGPGGAQVQLRDISSREVDSVPLTVADVFPEREIVAEPGLPPYTMIGEPQAGDDCGVAGDGEVKRLLGASDCSQFIRATFNSYDDEYYVTAGILNLADVAGAATVSSEIKRLVDTQQGRLTGYISDPSVRVVFRAAPHLAWEVRGHFLVYAVVVRHDGKDPADDQNARVAAHDMLQVHLLGTVIDRWATAKATTPAPESASASPAATPTA